jgi:hypothetical protein
MEKGEPLRPLAADSPVWLNAASGGSAPDRPQMGAPGNGKSVSAVYARFGQVTGTQNAMENTRRVFESGILHRGPCRNPVGVDEIRDIIPVAQGSHHGGPGLEPEEVT